MLRIGFARRWPRAVALLVVGTTAAGMLGLTAYSHAQTPAPQQPQTPQPQTPPSQPPPSQNPTPAAPANPSQGSPSQSGSGQNTPGQKSPDDQSKAPQARPQTAPAERSIPVPNTRNPSLPDSIQPLPGANVKELPVDHTVVFPTAVQPSATLNVSTPVDFRLPTPGTGEIGLQPNTRLPLFGWDIFASARALIDARRAYYARYAGLAPFANGGMAGSSPFAGTFQNGGPAFSPGLTGTGSVPGGLLSALAQQSGSNIPLPQPLSSPMPQLPQGLGQGPLGSQTQQGQGQGPLGSQSQQGAQGQTPVQQAAGPLGQAGNQQGNAPGAAGAASGGQGLLSGQDLSSQNPSLPLPLLGSLPQAGAPNFPGGGSAGGSGLPGGLGGDMLSQGGGGPTNIPFGNRALDPSHNILSPDEQSLFPVSMPAPERYQLAPGDVLQITIQSPTYEARSFSAEVDTQGRILVPIIGKPMVVRGLTPASLEVALRTQIRPALTNATVIVTLAQLRTMSIAILGESYEPGTYLMPPTVTLFNALNASGGPTINGSFRNIMLRRASGFTKRIDLYSMFMSMDLSQDVPLLPGDIIYIPPADGHIVVTGEVRRPATYEIRGGEHLRDAIRYAGGTLPTGIAQKIAIESVRPGAERVLVDASLVGLQSSNPPIYAGDTIDLYSIRSEVMNAVAIDGAVKTPREYAMNSGMTVADLVESARGLTRDAYPDRADLFRQNPDKTEKLIRIDLRQALAKDPTADVKLKPFDHLIVYTYDEVRSLGNRTVTVAGAVQRPGSFYRADNMTVRDILLEAGGLLPNAYKDTAFVQRMNPDGTPGPLVKLNLDKLLSGSASENVPMENLDVLTVETVQEANYVPDDQVQVVGAVQRPGVYVRGTNMKLSDLLRLSGGTLPNAYPDRAFLQHIELDGRIGPLVMVDLKGLVAGDPTSDMRLKTKDTLFVYTKDQAQYQAPQVVTVHGAVVNPGMYSKGPGMHLKDVLLLAGGKTPLASSTVEVAKARVPDGTPVARYDLKRVLAGDPGVNVAIDDGDMVSIPEDSTILYQPLVVRILGQVQNPGSYLVTSKTTRLSELVKRAGGLRTNAFPQGAQFFRDITRLYNKPAETLTPHIVALLKQITTDEYNRDLARGDIDKIRAVIQAQTGSTAVPVSISTSGIAPGNAGTPAATMQQATKARDPVTPARDLALDDLEVLGNLNVDVPAALAHPRGSDDLYLVDGDSITIPEKPVNVQIIGAVIAPSALVFKPGMTLGAYLKNVGGFTADAARNQVLIIRETGNVRQAELGTKLLLGDVVFVPTKVMADRLRDKQADFNSAVNTITTAGILLAVVSALTR